MNFVRRDLVGARTGGCEQGLIYVEVLNTAKKETPHLFKSQQLLKLNGFILLYNLHQFGLNWPRFMMICPKNVISKVALFPNIRMSEFQQVRSCYAIVLQKVVHHMDPIKHYISMDHPPVRCFNCVYSYSTSDP